MEPKQSRGEAGKKQHTHGHLSIRLRGANQRLNVAQRTHNPLCCTHVFSVDWAWSASASSSSCGAPGLGHFLSVCPSAEQGIQPPNAQRTYLGQLSSFEVCVFFLFFWSCFFFFVEVARCWLRFQRFLSERRERKNTDQEYVLSNIPKREEISPFGKIAFAKGHVMNYRLFIDINI